MLPTIQKAYCFLEHCQNVVLNTVHQLSSLRDPKATSGAASFAASPEVHVQIIYDKLAKLLSVLVILDGIILGHENLRGHWATYRRYIKAAISNPTHYNGVTKESMEHLEKMLNPAESKIIDGNFLKTCLDQDFDKKGSFFVTKNLHFGEELIFSIKTLMAEIEGDLSSISSSSSVMFSQELGGAADNRLKLVGLFCLIGLHNRLFHSIDRKVLGKMWELCKKVNRQKFN